MRETFLLKIDMPLSQIVMLQDLDSLFHMFEIDFDGNNFRENSHSIFPSSAQ